MNSEGETMTRKAFTDKTWADFPQGLSRETRVGSWEVTHDLAQQLADVTHLDMDQARILVSFAQSGLPLVLTWDTRLGGRYERQQVQTTTTTVIVERIFPPSKTRPDSYPGQIRLHYCGFSHDIYISEIVDIKNVEVTRTFRDVDPDA